MTLMDTSLCILIFFGIVATDSMSAQTLKNKVDHYVNEYVGTGDFSGNICITRNDSVLYNNSFGSANYSFKIPNNSNTKFKIGSISKQFTAAAILLLEEKGLLNTSDLLATHYPDKTVDQKITLEDLLNHTSGIIDIYGIENFNTLSCSYMKISELADKILDENPLFEPGSQYEYSNGGYALLADIIEKVSQMTYQQFMKEYVFTPLKMYNSGHANMYEVVENLSVGYDPLGYSGLKVAEHLDPELLKGSGSLYSTIHDLNLWINSIKERTFLSPKSYEKFLKDYGNNYGLGISVYQSFGQNVFGHDGRISGYIADYLHYSDTHTSIIILGNLQTGVADFFRRDIAAIVFQKEYNSRAKKTSIKKTEFADQTKIIGTYSFGPNFKVYVRLIENKLYAQANEGGLSELVELVDNRFFSRTLYAYVRFVEGDEGEVSKMVWTNNDGNSFDGMKM
ncbi:MAG: serine hydrolase [Bacteroidota bacterium]